MKLHLGRILETLTPSHNGRGGLRCRDSSDGCSNGSGGGSGKDRDLIIVSSEGPGSVVDVGEECTASSLDEETWFSSIFKKDTSDVDIFMASSGEEPCWVELDDWWIELDFELQFEADMAVESLKADVPFSTPNLGFGVSFQIIVNSFASSDLLSGTLLMELLRFWFSGYSRQSQRSA